jgi:hypothetical protein
MFEIGVQIRLTAASMSSIQCPDRVLSAYIAILYHCVLQMSYDSSRFDHLCMLMPLLLQLKQH